MESRWEIWKYHEEEVSVCIFCPRAPHPVAWNSRGSDDDCFHLRGHICNVIFDVRQNILFCYLGRAVCFFYYFVLVLDRNKINKDKQYRLLELIYFVFRFTGISQILLISNQHWREIRMILIARCRNQLDIGNHIYKIEVAYSVLKAIKCFHSFETSGE